ncbi:DUF6482 family protein [Halomonas halocynthiae]|uniref:DUF6482 family protein n=1 Tax=Halomonas halocynthiae TaxID=176290 RepID=UPI0004838C4C|nr:DUF6482 family protein [Halomonas halocynthiae]
MDFNKFKIFAKHNDNFEVRVISNASGSLCQLEVEDVEGQRHRVMRKGAPLLFRAAEEAYAQLRHLGIHHAYLVHQEARDEDNPCVGSYPRHQFVSRMPLAT